MDSQQASGIMMFAVIMAGVAALVFETAKAERKLNATRCICGHKYNGVGTDSHVRKSDYDNAAWVAGAEFKTGQCRGCKCRSFHPR